MEVARGVKLLLVISGGEVGVPRNLFPRLGGLDEVCTGEAWNLPSEGTGLGDSGWSVQPKGPVHWHWSLLTSRCMRVRVWTDIRVLHHVRTTTTTITTTTTTTGGSVNLVVLGDIDLRFQQDWLPLISRATRGHADVDGFPRDFGDWLSTLE